MQPDWRTEELVKLHPEYSINFKTDGKHGKTELTINSSKPISVTQTDNKLAVTSK